MPPRRPTTAPVQTAVAAIVGSQTTGRLTTADPFPYTLFACIQAALRCAGDMCRFPAEFAEVNMNPWNWLSELFGNGLDVHIESWIS